jgi:hypothetical protein
MSSELKQAEAIVDLLQPEEKEQLKRYIELSAKGDSSKGDSDAAWRAYREVGRQIGEIPRNGASATPKIKLNREQTLAAWKRIKQLATDEAGQSSEGPSALEIVSEMRNSRY